MPIATVDLRELVRRLATRTPRRSEATIQSDVRMLLLTAPLGLDDADLNEIVLESPAGARRRIDVEAGFTVIEVKRNLQTGHVLSEAVTQLTRYVRSRRDSLQQRYVGILTDGVEWRLYHLGADNELHEVSLYTVSPNEPSPEPLAIWLEGVLATTQQITPTPQEIERRLGALSSAHRLDFADLEALYAESCDLPGVQLKRELWAKLLTTAFGSNFRNDDALFIEHTLLVVMADVIAHSVVGFDPANLPPASILSGRLFDQAQITGVVEEDFFDWILEARGGDSFVRTLARRLVRFDWSAVEHDVMKVLYESVIDAEQRHGLGEYYTPDWLAFRMVDETVSNPLEERVLDPGCGSGTFLFHAVRRYLAAAETRGDSIADALKGVSEHVIGVDIHPVAVTLARVTYLLGIGLDRIRSSKRGPVVIPVYLGDTVQWGQVETLFSSGSLTVPTDDSGQLFSADLRFPEGLVADAARFDRLVAELADRAAQRAEGSPPPSLAAAFRRYAVPPSDQQMVSESFKLMCDLHDQGRDHIWGYYVRNLARPVWLSRSANRVDVLVGNPPWLSYRYMTSAMQEAFRAMSQERGLWIGGTMSTAQDLSDLFVSRCIELYLRLGGRFAFVMPLAVLTRQQFEGFRAGTLSSLAEQTIVAFNTPWNLDAVRPHVFPVPSSVVSGERVSTTNVPMPSQAEIWSGLLPDRDVSWDVAASLLTHGLGNVRVAGGEHASVYHGRFAQGATIVPSVLLRVEDAPPGPLGAGAGRRAVRSMRSRQEKAPWKTLPSLEGVVESQFVRPVHLGSTVVPYRCLQPGLAVIPWDGTRMLSGEDSRIDLYPGMADWWRRAERIWLEHRSSGRMTLLDRLDFRKGATSQFPAAAHRIVYSASGNQLASAIIGDTEAFIEHKLYWASAASLDEARYLTAVLNSATLTNRVAPLQSRGQFGARDFDLYVFQVPIPLFEDADPLHVQLVKLAQHAEAVAAAVDLPEDINFQTARRRVRRALADDGVASAIDKAVERLIPPIAS